MEHLGFTNVFQIKERLTAIQSKAAAAEALSMALDDAFKTCSKERIAVYDHSVKVPSLPVDEAKVRELIEELGLAMTVTQSSGGTYFMFDME